VSIFCRFGEAPLLSFGGTRSAVCFGAGFCGAAHGVAWVVSRVSRQGVFGCVAILLASAVRLGRVCRSGFGLLRGRRPLGRICVTVCCLLLAVLAYHVSAICSRLDQRLFCRPLRPLPRSCDSTRPVTLSLDVTFSRFLCGHDAGPIFAAVASATSQGSVRVLLKVLCATRSLPRWASRANWLLFLDNRCGVPRYLVRARTVERG